MTSFLDGLSQGAALGRGIYQGGQRKQAQATRQAIGGQIAGGDIQGASQAAYQAGELDLGLEISKMPDPQKQALQQKAQRMGRLAAALQSMPYEQRRERLTSPGTQQALAGIGFSPEQLQGFDPNDGNLSLVAGQFREIEDILTGQHKGRVQDEVERSALVDEGQTDFSNQTARMNANTARTKAQQQPGGGEIRLPDGTTVRTGGAMKEFQARPTILSPGLSEAAAALGDVFDGQTNPLNEPRNVAAAAANIIPGAGGALSGAIGGQGFQDANQPRAMTEAAVLPILSGAAITKEETPRFRNAFIPQVGDTPETARIKVLTVQEMAARVTSMQASGQPLTEDQLRSIVLAGEASIARRSLRPGGGGREAAQPTYSPDNPFAGGQ